MTVLVKRSSWGARAAKQGTTSIIARPSVTGHYVGGGWKWPWYHDSCDDKVREIQAWHMDDREWSDIAYNYLACPHDFVYEGRGFGRRSSANGTEFGNQNSFAICCLWGENSAKALPDGLKTAFLFARKILMVSGGATSVLKGHRDWKATECPGDLLYAWIEADCPSPVANSGFEDIVMLSNEAQAEVRQIVREEIKFATTNGQPLHEVVQAYAAFGAKHSDQLVDDTGEYAGKVTDLLLKDDFQRLKTDLITEIKTLLQAPPSQQ
jgi:hypothetical protein